MSETEHISELAPTTLGTIVDDVERVVASALRIVPIHDLRRRHRKAPAALTYNGGPLLTAIRLVPIYHGSAWQDAANRSMVASIDAYFAWLPTSPLIDQLAEYSVPGQAIGHGSTLPSVLIPDALGPTLADGAIQATLTAKLADGTLPADTDQTLYVVLVAPGTAVTAFGSKSCASFCGYHQRTTAGVFYAVLAYPDCAGCLGTLTPLQALCSTVSHEVSEAITDPKDGTGWVDANGLEIGDKCAWETKSLDGWTVQLEYSDASKGCI